MASDISTIQSLKAVDAWIDVINANINGGVRTAFKASRLKFTGSNTDVSRAGTATSLPLQFPEPGLTTANTVIDFSQGAITTSTENTHLAIQGEGFFLLASPETINVSRTPNSTQFGRTVATSRANFLITRDGEFHTDENGFLRTSFGYYLMRVDMNLAGTRSVLQYDLTTQFGGGSGLLAVRNDLDTTGPPLDTAGNPTLSGYLDLSTFVAFGSYGGGPTGVSVLIKVDRGQQNLQYSRYGSTVFDLGFTPTTVLDPSQLNPALEIYIVAPTEATIHAKSLEASNASMTQSVPELSLAQKLFSALTKVLQTKQTNVDGVLNLVR